MRIGPDSRGPNNWKEFQARNESSARKLVQNALYLAADVCSYVANACRSVLGPKTGNHRKGTDIGRRRFLQILGGAALALPLGKMAVEGIEQHNEIADAAQGFRERVGNVRNLESVPEECLIPEDERSGENIMIGTIPTYFPIPVPGVRQYGVKGTFGTELSPVLNNFPGGTNVHLVTTEDARDEVLDFARKSHEGLNFQSMDLPRARGGLDYMQDVVMATGGTDEQGKFIIAASSLDANDFGPVAKVNAEARKVAGFYQPLISLERLRGIAVDPDDEVTAMSGLQQFGDEVLVEEHADKFDLKYVPVKCEGGDLQIVRMPDGKTGLVVGKQNVFFSAFALALKEGGVDVENVEDVRSLEMQPLKFAKLLEQVRANYMDYFGVEKVVILDEEDLLRRVSRVTAITLGAAVDMDFFHSDMVVKTATDKDGKPVAFCSMVDKTDRNYPYLARIRQQFEDLGYEIEELPCGEYATFNYTNTTMFSSKGAKQKVVIVPQFGIPEDAHAVEVYRRRGFEVRTADHSYIKDRDPKSAKRSGASHCKVVVLN